MKPVLLFVAALVVLAGLGVASAAGASMASASHPTKLGPICIYVETLAVKNGQCVLYHTPCDVPKGWKIVRECPQNNPEDEKNTHSPQACEPNKHGILPKRCNGR